jgi:hypothetical protein
MAGRSRQDRRGSGPLWFVMLVVTLFVLYSAAIAISTGDDCGDAGREWQWWPPEWECKPDPNFG